MDSKQETQLMVLHLIRAERSRQDEKWERGERGWEDHDLVKFAVLAEELGETAQATIEQRNDPADPHSLPHELVQVAAVAISWLESLPLSTLQAM